MATIKEIAQALNVSPSTVSIVLNGNAEKRKVAQKTKERVLKAAEEMGYHPSLEARRLRSVQDGDELEDDIIAIFWPLPLRETILVRFLQAFQDYAEQVGSQYTTSIYFFRSGKLAEQEKLFRKNKFHAALIYGALQEDVDFLENSNFMGPKILLGPWCDHTSLKRCHAVISDLYEISMQFLSVMKAHGGTTLACCQSGIYTDLAGQDRALQELGMDLYPTDLAKGSIDGGYEWAMKYLKGHEDHLPFDCIYAGSERMGFGVTRALEDLSISVPRQMRVVAVDVYHLNFQEFSRPQLASVDLGIENMARICIDILQSIVGSAEPEVKVVKNERFYIPGESC